VRNFVKPPVLLFPSGSSILALVAGEYDLKRGFFAFREKWGRGQGEWGNTSLLSDILEKRSQNEEFRVLVLRLWNNYNC
jgi:hypothetical protein